MVALRFVNHQLNRKVNCQRQMNRYYFVRRSFFDVHPEFYSLLNENEIHPNVNSMASEIDVKHANVNATNEQVDGLAENK